MTPLSTTRIPEPFQTQALSCATFRPPPLDGSYTLVDMCEWHRHHSPSHPVFSFVDEDGQRKSLTWEDVSPTIHRGARIVQDRLSRSSSLNQSERAVVAIVSLSETISYSITVLSLMRAGFIPFLISPTHSPNIVAHLFEKANVKHVLVSPDNDCQELVRAAMELSKLHDIPKTSPMLVFGGLFPPSSAPYIPHVDVPLPRDRRLGNIAVYIHSSGSTSQYPTLIPWTNRKLIELGTVPYYSGRDLTGSVISTHCVPMFHSLAVSILSMMATTGLTAACFHPQFPPVVPNPENVLSASEKTACDVILTFPRFVEEWSQHPETLDWLAKKRGYLAIGGGSLSKEAGDKLVSRGVNVVTQYGATEVGIMSTFLPQSSPHLDWEYFEFCGYADVRTIPVLGKGGESDGTFEVTVVPSPTCIPTHTNKTLSDSSEECYATSDLVVPHPTKKGFWKIYGRIEDQIVHSSGEKTNPGPMEDTLRRDPQIREGIIFGHGRFHVGVLVELEQQGQLEVDRLWAAVKKMNTRVPQHSRVLKEMIIVGDSAKPFLDSAQGTRRQPTLDLYKDEINTLYKSIEPPGGMSFIWDRISTKAFVRATFKSVLPDKQFGDATNILTQGCNSMHAIQIRNIVSQAIRETTHPNVDINTPFNIVYERPTVIQLADYILSTVTPRKAPTVSSDELKVQEMYHLLGKYSADFAKPRLKRTRSMRFRSLSGCVNWDFRDEEMDFDDHRVVLLAGSTGSLGSFILSTLLRDTRVACVYALNNVVAGSCSRTRQIMAFEQKGLETKLLRSEKLRLLDVEFGQKDLGLGGSVLKRILKSVKHVIHNAWPTNFNLGLSSFEDALVGLQNLLDISLRAQARFILLSSTGVFSNTSIFDSPTERFAPAHCALGTGYTESKWIAEQLVLITSAPLTHGPMIIRVGEICGSRTSGAWNSREWAPAIIESAKTLGCIPGDDRVVSWICPEDASRTIVDIVLMTPPNDKEAKIFHIRHPKPVSWTSLATVVASELKVDIVPSDEWLKKLEAMVNDGKGSGYASRLLSFYQSTFRNSDSTGQREAFGMPLVAIERTLGVSQSLMRLSSHQLGEEDVKGWIQYWKERGVL